MYFCNRIQVPKGSKGNPVKIRSYSRSCKFRNRFSPQVTDACRWEDGENWDKPEDLPAFAISQLSG